MDRYGDVARVYLAVDSLREFHPEPIGILNEYLAPLRIHGSMHCRPTRNPAFREALADSAEAWLLRAMRVRLVRHARALSGMRNGRRHRRGDCAIGRAVKWEAQSRGGICGLCVSASASIGAARSAHLAKWSQRSKGAKERRRNSKEDWPQMGRMNTDERQFNWDKTQLNSIHL